MALEAHDVGFGYVADRPVLRSVTTTFRPGRLGVLVGPNGAGKSTLLRLLIGAMRPDRGSISLDGKDVRSMSRLERAGRLAYVAQRPELAFPFSVRHVVEFGHFSGRPNADLVDEALVRVGLAERASEPFGVLSIGQQQRVSLARALVQVRSGAREVSRGMLVDEPVSAMDPRHAVESLDILRSLSRSDDLVTIVVLHDLSLAARFADDAVVLAGDGSVAASGPAPEILVPAILEPVFRIGFHRVDLGPDETPAVIPGALQTR